MNYFLGLQEVSIHGRYTKYPNQSFEITINESDIDIWRKYIIPLFNSPDFEEYLNNDAAWIWPVSDFSKYTNVDSDNNFLRVKKTCLITDEEQMGRVDCPFELGAMVAGEYSFRRNKYFHVTMGSNGHLEDEIYRRTKLNQILRWRFSEKRKNNFL